MNLVFVSKAAHFARAMTEQTDTPATPPMRAGIVPVTPLQQNCSLVWCTKTNKGALIDPGGVPPPLLCGEGGRPGESLPPKAGLIRSCGPKPAKCWVRSRRMTSSARTGRR